jgi:anti-sigma regulatory factor (Ser/Thr protein kinase)
MQDASKWETSFPNDLAALLRAIEELDGWLGCRGADAEARYLARLAVEELGTNIIKYAYDDLGQHEIHLSVACEARVFRILLQDDGHPFDPCQTPEPDPNLSLGERTAGGWGLSLVRRLLAGMEYERRGDWNSLCMLVPRAAKSQAGS